MEYAMAIHTLRTAKLQRVVAGEVSDAVMTAESIWKDAGKRTIVALVIRRPF